MSPRPTPSRRTAWWRRWVSATGRRLAGRSSAAASTAAAAAGEREPAKLPPGLARKVRRIEIATKRLVERGMAGQYHAVFKGRGVEFAEVRPYQPGDDVRTIDWNVTARTGEPHIKTFVEERDLTVFLAVDVSGSLSYGSRTIVKRDLAAEVSALLAFAAVANGDRVGAALLGEGLGLYLPPRRRRSHVLRLVREILTRPAAGGTDLERALGGVVKTLPRRAVLFLVTDLLAPPPAAALQAAAARHDVVVIEIVDPLDLELPRAAPVVLADAETGRTAVVDGERLAAAHGEHRQRERRAAARLFARLGIDHLVLATDRPYLPSLDGFFGERRRRAVR